jgi:Protein of unknown function (DUF2934)
MAEENTRPGRGRKKDGTTDKRKKPTTAKARTTKAAAKTATTKARRPKLVVEPTRESIAEQAYLLWERGEPGGETDHWLRAEAELRAA